MCKQKGHALGFAGLVGHQPGHFKIANNATLYHLGILTSAMHDAWLRTVCGRLESRYRYSTAIVYNNLPWLDLPGSCRKNKPSVQA